MATFPRTESNLMELTQEMINGINQYGALFPSISPAARLALENSLHAYEAARNAQASAQAVARNATIAKEDAQEDLEAQIRKVIHLAEHDSMGSPGNLNYLGWGVRKRPSPMAAPGQPRELQPVYEEAGRVTLTWKKPADGGAVASYRVQRSDQPAGGGIPGPWTLMTTSFTAGVTLSDQPRGIEMHYRVSAINAAGESLPSNIATVVL